MRVENGDQDLPFPLPGSAAKSAKEENYFPGCWAREALLCHDFLRHSSLVFQTKALQHFCVCIHVGCVCVHMCVAGKV